ncbi:MAG TPA: ABC transporter ATP-binding protein [Candidatus Lokiarchaeia archaeon]|nr:ABC transporter ATP-binding protein [Candidatus Lokiarchaeia archaeon]
MVDEESMVLELKNITKIYKNEKEGNMVLKGLDFRATRGSLITISGPSGSGKSTLLNIIGLIDRDFQGEYYFDRTQVQKLKESTITNLRLKKIGFIFQSFNLIDALNVEHNIEYPLALMGIPAAMQRAKSEKYLKRLGIYDKRKNFPNKLSVGERQRVAIARAMAKEPYVILADEPTGDLDHDNTLNFIEMLKEIIDEKPDLITIIVSHNDQVISIGKIQYRLRSGFLHEKQE